MPDYRRFHVPGGSYFFTVVTYNRQRIFDDPQARMLLGNAFRECQQEWPFEVKAIVLLPDHLHALWNLPSGDDDYSKRWSCIKRLFTQAWLASGGRESTLSADQMRQRRRGFWQPRFWEHVIRDEKDFEAHFDYVHFNPVKHQYVRCPKDWEASSFHRWVQRGVYDENWACGCGSPLRNKPNMVKTTGEP